MPNLDDFRFYFETQSDGDEGILIFHIYLRYLCHEIKKRWYSTSYQPAHIEVRVSIFLLSGMVLVNILNTDQTKRGISFFSGDIATANQSSRRTAVVSIFDLGPLEIVDANEWEGLPREDLMRSDGGVAQRQPTYWDIAAIDERGGGRVIFVRTSLRKDDVMVLRHRLSAVLDYVRQKITPYKDLCDRMIKMKAISLSGLPKGTTHDHAVMYDEIARAYDERDWGFDEWNTLF